LGDSRAEQADEEGYKSFLTDRQSKVFDHPVKRNSLNVKFLKLLGFVA